MTLAWIEGFDHLFYADLHKKGWQGDTPKDITQPGRVRWGHNSRALRLEFPHERVFKSFTGTPGVWIFGVAFKPDSMGTGLSENFIDFFNEHGTCGGLALQESGGDVVLVITDSSGTVVGTGTTLLNAGDWHYYEIKINFSSLSGHAEAHLDGVSEIASVTGSFSNLDGGPTWVALNASGAARWWFDDMYVLDTAAAPHDDWLGDNCIETLYPVEDGFHTDWTPDTGTKHYVRVNEGQADGDTSFVHTDAAGDKDTYGLENLGITVGAPVAAQLNVEVRKTESATREIAPLIRQAGTDYDGPTYTIVGPYQVYSWMLDQDPSGSDWTIETINADEYGVEVIT